MLQVGLEIPIITPLVEGALDVVSSVFDRVPGSAWIKESVKAGASFLGDMAKTPGGRTILTAITMVYLYGPLSAARLPGAVGQVVVGPIVASTVWAIPGMMAGDSFVEAYTWEVSYRIEELIKHFAGRAAGEAFAKQLKDLTNNPAFQAVIADFKARFGALTGRALRRALEEAGVTPEKIAFQFQTRADVAGAAINAAVRDNVFDVNSEFDWDGRVLPPEGIVARRYPISEVLAGPRGTVKRPTYDVSKTLVGEAMAASSGPIFGLSSPTSSLLGQLVSAMLLTSPAWGALLIAKRRRR